MWEDIKTNPRFQSFLRAAVEDWNKPMNTPERVKLKAACMVEMGLETLWREMNNTKEPLSSRVALFQTVMKMGDIATEKRGVGEGGGEKFSVVINLGADNQLKISAALPVPKLIDASEDA
jgi:hypothetical protein